MNTHTESAEDCLPPDAVHVRTHAGVRRISRADCPFVIAEAGVNHNGSVEIALRLVDAAAQAGADAVKFQVFTTAELVTSTAPAARYQQDRARAANQQAMLKPLELADDALDRICAHCRDRGITMLATPFSVVDLRRCDRLKLPALKIASTDLNNRPLLDAAIRRDLPLIVSVGASTGEEIVDGVRFIQNGGRPGRLILLHCVSAYPTPIASARLGSIAALGSTFGVPTGLSDHTTSTHTGAWAVAAGACVLEKHFTLDRTHPGPDHAVSLLPEELRCYVAEARDAWTALGSAEFGMSPIEEDVRAVARKSIVAAGPIPRGTRLTDAMLAVKRPGSGIDPNRLGDVVGRTTCVDIAPDELLNWGMLR